MEVKMALCWDPKNVPDLERKLEENPRMLDCLVWASLYIGLGEITDKNVKEWVYRLRRATFEGHPLIVLQDGFPGGQRPALFQRAAEFRDDTADRLKRFQLVIHLRQILFEHADGRGRTGIIQDPADLLQGQAQFPQDQDLAQALYIFRTIYTIGIAFLPVAAHQSQLLIMAKHSGRYAVCHGHFGNRHDLLHGIHSFPSSERG